MLLAHLILMILCCTILCRTPSFYRDLLILHRFPFERLILFFILLFYFLCHIILPIILYDASSVIYPSSSPICSFLIHISFLFSFISSPYLGRFFHEFCSTFPRTNSYQIFLDKTYSQGHYWNENDFEAWHKDSQAMVVQIKPTLQRKS